jgi:hypothetical protein
VASGALFFGLGPIGGRTRIGCHRIEVSRIGPLADPQSNNRPPGQDAADQPRARKGRPDGWGKTPQPRPPLR